MPTKLSFLVPLENENRWSDLLGVLISTDPAAAAEPLGLGQVTGCEVVVAREVRAGLHDRVDLLISVDGELRTVLEAKVLSGLGHQQLARYTASYGGAASYRLVYPARLAIHPGDGSGWIGTSWEALLEAFAESNDPWVAETATAWLEHLRDALPGLGSDTRWNAVPEGEPYALAMRARMSWVYNRLAPPSLVTSDLMQSGGSKTWVARVQAPAARAGYEVGAEAEGQGARAWPPVGTAEPNPSVGPSVWVGLRQHDVQDSTRFDWDYLNSMWPTMAATRTDWVATRPGLPTAPDKENWRRIGSPPQLGFGFGDKQAIKSGTCMFGAKFRLPADIELGDLVAELQATADLVLVLSSLSI